MRSKNKKSTLLTSTESHTKCSSQYDESNDFKLNRVENPYQIKRELDEYEKLLRQIRYILNRLTSKNFNKLTADFVNLPINTQERLDGTTDLIFETSINDNLYMRTYAQLSKALSAIKVPSRNEPDKLINFRTMLLTKCQREFDSDYSQNINYEKLLVEAENHPDETKRKELREIAANKLSRAKRRSLGNIRFIGELFKLQMLTEGIMNDCIDRLLKQESDEENLVCLCKLLTTIGKELDNPHNAASLNIYFERLIEISNKKDLVSSRMRFMIIDLIDLRSNQWMQRSIEDILREAEEKQASRAAEYANAKQLHQRNPNAKGNQNKGCQQGKKAKSITNKNLNGDLTDDRGSTKSNLSSSTALFKAFLPISVKNSRDGSLKESLSSCTVSISAHVDVVEKYNGERGYIR